MKQKIFVALFAVVCLALFAVSITLYNCHRANVMLRKTVISEECARKKLDKSEYFRRTARVDRKAQEIERAYMRPRKF